MDSEIAARLFEATPQGVLITDRELRILSVNPAFIATTGFSAEEVRGETPKLLASGRHDEAFYQQLWATLRETGCWQGEIWNRRKNGEVYPEWLTITALRDETGEVTHYAGTFSDLSAQEQVQERLRSLAYYDVLTDLPNRLLFRDRLTHALAQARREGHKVALMFLDLDRFKTINDTLGHSAGDTLLRTVADRIKCHVRESDTVARLGGDEFTIMLTHLQSKRDITPVANKLISALSEPMNFDGQDLYITTSIGIALFPDDGEDDEALLKNADTAMYRAKTSGRDNYQFFTREMGEAVAERLRLENDLRKAMERGELDVHYQPQVDLESGTMVGMEALVRWQHPERGNIPPDRFIPIAEESGLIIQLGEWVLRRSLKDLKRWLIDGHSELRMAVNLSPLQLRQRELPRHIASILDELGLDSSHLELELTESMLVEDSDLVSEVIAKLSDMGVRLAIDDFGTGYSSLAHLRRFAIDKLKIDRSFVRDLVSDQSDAELASTIIAMGHKLNLKVIAEGAEVVEQLDFLREQNCDEMQGYFYSPPLTREEMAGLLNDRPSLDD